MKGRWSGRHEKRPCLVCSWLNMAQALIGAQPSKPSTTSRKCNFTKGLASSAHVFMQLLQWWRDRMCERDHLRHAALAASSHANICINFAGKGNNAHSHRCTFSCANRAARCPGRSDHRADCSSSGFAASQRLQLMVNGSKWSSRKAADRRFHPQCC